MLGYRLVRNGDFDALQAERRALLEKVEALQDRYVDEVRATAEIRAEVRSKQTMIDMLTARVNVLERQTAENRFARTGIPQTFPSIAAGAPRRTELMGETDSLFEDVGDEAADRLRKANALHEVDQDVLFVQDGIQ